MLPYLLNPLGIDKGNSEIEDGSEQYPYLIKNVDDFFAFRNAISAGETFAGVWHKLVNDIDLTGVTFAPLSNESYAGNFEGNFKKISNFIANNSYGVWMITTGIIRNLGVDNINATLINFEEEMWEKCGQIFGGITSHNYGLIMRCYATGEVTSMFPASGIVGKNMQNGLILDCWSDVIILTTEFARSAGIANCYEGNIERCIAHGNINGGSGVMSRESGQIAPKNCVAAMGTINSGARIYWGMGATDGLGINNYALDTMIVGSSPVISSDPKSFHGANAHITQLKSLAFYRDVMGWNIADKHANFGTETWEIDDGNDFPKLMGFT